MAVKADYKEREGIFDLFIELLHGIFLVHRTRREGKEGFFF
jgi:hypothetical protein